ncbi:hypothetical protein Tco_0582523 [Tanacetum coccineum]
MEYSINVLHENWKNIFNNRSGSDCRNIMKRLIRNEMAEERGIKLFQLAATVVTPRLTQTTILSALPAGSRLCFCGPRVRLPVEYTLELPKELNSVHSTFHVSNLKKCLSDESLVIPMKELWLDDTLNFMEERVEIMDREVKQLRQIRIPIVKVRWNSKRGPEFTWEREDQSRAKYPHLFSNITLTSN